MKNTKKQFLIVIAILAGIAIYESVVIFDQNATKIKVLTSDNQTMKANLQERDSVVNELMSTFDEIEKNLNFVKGKRQQLTLATNKEEKKNERETIISDIQLMNQMLDESSKHIEELEKKLKKSGIKLNSFRRKIASLTKDIEEQNTEIAMLQSQIKEKDNMLADLGSKLDTMNDKVTKMEVVINQKADTVLQQQQEIEEKTTKLNKAYLACGTYKELEENGVLTKEGGFLGLGKKSSIKKNLEDEKFIKLDIRETKKIPVHSTKAVLVSEHPDSSYNFIEEEGQISYLEIENPEEFWKISKYAVIEVK